MKHTNIYNYLNTSNIINYKRILCFILNNPYGITAQSAKMLIDSVLAFFDCIYSQHFNYIVSS